MRDLRVGVVGAGSFVGRELLRLLARHPRVEVAFAASEMLESRPVKSVVDGWSSPLSFEPLSPALCAAREVDAFVLAVSDNESHRFVGAIDEKSSRAVVVDLSGDHRGDEGWVYGLPERHRGKIEGSRRIANPGVQASAFQLVAEPILPFTSGPLHGFGVSGSGGRNDLAAAAEGTPYAVVDQSHERELTSQLGRGVCFVPHVAPSFRGLTVTLSASLARPSLREDLAGHLSRRYKGERLVRVDEDVPAALVGQRRHEVRIGGLSVSDDGGHVAVVAAIDDVVTTIASTAIRNMNLALRLPELEGVTPWLD